MMEFQVQDVPQPLMNKLVRDAKRRDVSLTAAAVEILCREYGVEDTAERGGFGADPPRAALLLSMPEDLHLAIKLDAAGQKGVTMRGLIIASLARHYNVKVPSTARRARGTTTGGK